MSVLERRVIPYARSGPGQVALFLSAYLLYGLSRYICVGDADTAIAHAHRVLDAERSVAPDLERSVQAAFTDSALLWLLDHVYLAAQLVVVPGALVWLFRRRARAYAQLRNTVLVTWVIALPIYALFPCAPPRLADVGLIDTITSQTGIALTSRLTTSFYNQFAAVPSLHAGFALAVSIALASTARRWWSKALALTWAPLVSLSVLATGNHFALDVLAGFAVTGAGYAISRTVLRHRVRWPFATPTPECVDESCRSSRLPSPTRLSASDGGNNAPAPTPPSSRDLRRGAGQSVPRRRVNAAKASPLPGQRAEAAPCGARSRSGVGAGQRPAAPPHEHNPA